MDKFNFSKSRLAKKLGYYVILTSTIITIFTAGFQIFSEFQRDLGSVHDELKQIKKTHLSNISARVWLLDTEELEITLNNILGLPNIEYIAVYEHNKLFMSAGVQTNKNVLSEEYILDHISNNKKTAIGKLVVNASLENTYQQIIDRAVIIVLSNAAKTFIIAGLILLIFYQLIAKHLTHISKYAETISLDNLDREFSYKRKVKANDKVDELDTLANSLSNMQNNLKEASESILESKKIIADSEAKFRGVLESSADGVILVNSDGKIELVNKTLLKMTGYQEQELLNHSLELLVPRNFENHPKLREDYFKSPVLRNMGTGITLFARRKDESEFPVEISLTPVKTDKGIIVSAMVQDVSKRKKDEQEKENLIESLEQKNAELERFTYTASHDLKSPLVTISGFIGLLKKDIEANNNERVESDLERIAEATKTMQQLLDDMLELSRIGRMDMPHTNVSLSKIIDAVTEMLAVKINDTKAKINIEDNLPHVIVEEPRFKELYLNLIENALKYKHPDRSPIISIGIAKSKPNNNTDDKKMTTFFVKDNGIGIDPQFRSKIFSLFERLDNSLDGSGVGLAIVKRIIEVHKGKIWVEGNPDNDGSCFYFKLPNNIITTSNGAKHELTNNIS